MRRAAKIDANQRAVVAALRAAGAAVVHLHAVGNGCPDLLVGYRGRYTLLEVKDGSKTPSARRLTQDQVRFHAEHAQLGLPCFVVESIDEALHVASGGFL